MEAFAIILFIFLAFIIWVVLIYNNLVKLRNRFKNAFAQIDVQLRRRYDLIPNLVETAKAYIKHERETLEVVFSGVFGFQAAELFEIEEACAKQAVRIQF